MTYVRNGFISVAVIAIVVLAIGGGIGYLTLKKSEERQVVCTMDVKECPDGSYVGRRGPKCEFAPCPEIRMPENKFIPSQAAPLSPEKLRAEMEIGLKSGGGVHPDRFAAMKRELDALAAQGFDVAGLRALLGKFVVGGGVASKPPVQASPPKQETVRVETRPFWEFDPAKPDLGWYWAREGAPPACPEPLVLESPIDVNLVTGILYPGQVRGNGPKDFKPHGGFQLKAGTKSVEIRAPMDGYLTAVAKFTDEFGYHVGLAFQHPCGILFGGGHWGALPPDIQAVVDKVPLKGFKESQNQPIIPPYFVKKGQIIVTGLQEGANPERPGFDWGVADYRKPNAASYDPRFRELYGSSPWNTYYGVCWLDLLPPEQQAVLRPLPGVDGKQGKNSEYCK